ncbi:unnamed protein product [Closterium sp. NIES-53]
MPLSEDPSPQPTPTAANAAPTNSDHPRASHTSNRVAAAKPGANHGGGSSGSSMSTEALTAATVRAIANINIQDYSHSPIHTAILQRDYHALRRILASVPHPPIPGSIKTEEQSLAAEVQADVAQRTLDRRDVPHKESPLCLAVRLGDRAAVELLVQAGADVSLQNGGGWTAIQEAVCTRDEVIATAILRHSGVQVWARYMRRLPALAAILTRMRDFYMEVTWSFESSVIPFVSRIAPSDTYRIWKRGPRLRADMTLAGFDGFRLVSGLQASMRDFYMEVTWSFESPIIPFVLRIAPSDTYRIRKRGPRLRTDMTSRGLMDSGTLSSPV